MVLNKGSASTLTVKEPLIKLFGLMAKLIKRAQL